MCRTRTLSNSKKFVRSFQRPKTSTTILLRHRAGVSPARFRITKSVYTAPQVAKKTGLEKIRAECSQFDEWVMRLEALGGVV